MKFKGIFVAPRINFQRYRQAIHETLMEQLSLACFAWLNETADKIPQWSGASAATFLHLARQASYTLPISQAPGAPDRVSLGLRHGEGEFIVDQSRGTYVFTYGTTLEHLIFNEFNNANITHDPAVFSRLLTPGPYRFQERGRVAFLRVASAVRLPNPFDSLKLNKIRVR